MIDKLRGIAIFSTVVDQGSFRAAALHLGLAPSRISETVSELEAFLGVTLLYRSTRQLSLTHEGTLLHAKALDMLEAAEGGLDAINPSSKEPRGLLRVTAPAFIKQTSLMDSFAAFSKTYPKVSLSFDFSDRPRALIKDGYDVGIRAGWLKDSELLTRNIGYADRLLVASPEYASAHPPPAHPDDLEAWDWIRFAVIADGTKLTNAEGEAVTVVGKSTVSVNAADALFEFAVRGLGVASIPENLAKRGFERGELVHILPSWTLRPLGLHATWPSHAQRENLTVMFVRFLAEANTLSDGGPL